MEQEPKFSSQERFYSLILPDRLFGYLTSNEMDKEVPLRLPIGNVISIFELLEEVHTSFSGKGRIEVYGGKKLAILLASNFTIQEMLNVAKKQGLPVNEAIIGEYKEFATTLEKNTGLYEKALALSNRKRKRNDPFTRELTEEESKMFVEMPIKVDQLSLISRVFMARFREVLGEKTGEENLLPFIKSVGILQRILVDLKLAKLKLPVAKNAVRLIEAAYEFSGLFEERI